MGLADMSLIEKFPQIKIPNKFYINKGSMQFEDMENHILNNEPNFSNGAVYADFDNDGKLDVVVNNINDKVTLYHNVYTAPGPHHFVNIKLQGDGMNKNAVGSKIFPMADHHGHNIPDIHDRLHLPLEDRLHRCARLNVDRDAGVIMPDPFDIFMPAEGH